jgi:hypothetical protein
MIKIDNLESCIGAFWGIFIMIYVGNLDSDVDVTLDYF